MEMPDNKIEPDPNCPSEFIDLVGKKFGRLIVVKRISNSKGGKLRWLCRCNCRDRNEIVVQGSNLKDSHTRSCGCLQKEIVSQTMTKHGHWGDKTYKSWADMIQRCTNPNNKYYKDYGGRGIKVCKRWLKFENFLVDMVERPPELTLDRKNNNKNYCKSNCRWTTWKEQQRNRRNNRYETYEGRTQLLVEWAEEYKIPYKTLWRRIYEYGWSIEKALTTPVKTGGKLGE